MGEPKLRVLSLGAGVQSTTMALMAAHGEADFRSYGVNRCGLCECEFRVILPKRKSSSQDRGKKRG